MVFLQEGQSLFSFMRPEEARNVLEKRFSIPICSKAKAK